LQANASSVEAFWIGSGAELCAHPASARRATIAAWIGNGAEPRRAIRAKASGHVSRIAWSALPRVAHIAICVLRNDAWAAVQAGRSWKQSVNRNLTIKLNGL
jgi:hypothetical protein